MAGRERLPGPAGDSERAADTTLAPAVDEALRGFRDMLATDGYELRWSVSSPGAVVVQVVAGEGACADCLVPRPLMEGILADALGPAGYALDRVMLPADG